MLDAREVEIEHPTLRVTDISLEFKLNDAIFGAWIKLERSNHIDIVLVPFPVMTALKIQGYKPAKARVCRMADRVTKVIHHDKFCI